jgi:hypothetical protein
MFEHVFEYVNAPLTVFDHGVSIVMSMPAVDGLDDVVRALRE